MLQRLKIFRIKTTGQSHPDLLFEKRKKKSADITFLCLNLNLGSTSHVQLNCAGCNTIQKPRMRNGFAANCGCQFLSLSYPLIDGLKGV